MSDISPAGTLFRHTLRVTLQGIFTLALTLLGLLVITFALSALSPVDGYYRLSAITPAMRPMSRYGWSWGSISPSIFSSGIMQSVCCTAISAWPPLWDSRCSTAC